MKRERMTLWLVRDRSAGGQILDVTDDREMAVTCCKSYRRTFWHDEDGKPVRTRAYVEKVRAALTPAE